MEIVQIVLVTILVLWQLLQYHEHYVITQESKSDASKEVEHE